MTAPSSTTYADYLKLEDLLTAQAPLTDHPDELHFIVVHQVHELWFKLALHHLSRARESLHAGALPEAIRLLEQVSAIFSNLTAAVEHLQSLPPNAFHRFRRFLAPGSGLQSYQFRAIEFALGMRDPEHITWVQHVLVKQGTWDAVAPVLEQLSLADAFAEQLDQHDVTDLADIYAQPDAYPSLYALCETLSVLDQQMTRWRFSHIQLVERTIGTGAVGTGGTTHDYLAHTLRTRAFPTLWAARDTLTARINQAHGL